MRVPELRFLILGLVFASVVLAVALLVGVVYMNVAFSLGN